MSQAIAVPSSATELCAAVREAQPFTLSQLDRILDVDEAAGLAEVQAGVRWGNVAAELRPEDACARSLDTTMPTVGESLAWNAAGPDGRPAVAHVESMALVTPDGALCRVSRRKKPELFALVLGGHNLFGVPYSVTLRLRSLERAIEEAMPVETLAFGDNVRHGRPLLLLVPAEGLERFVAKTRERCDAWRLPLSAMQARRVLAEEDTFLRWARRDYLEVTLHFNEPVTLGRTVRGLQLRQELIDAAIALGGTFPISCTPEATRAQIFSCYPEITRFIAEKRRLDPRERLVNPWYWHHRSVLERRGCAVRWGS